VHEGRQQPAASRLVVQVEALLAYILDAEVRESRAGVGVLRTLALS
jgi:hypothetical protein